MPECKKKLIHKAVDDAFKYYQKRGYDGHLTQPQIIEESKQIAEKLAETKMHKGKGFDYIASIASFISCESRGCPINLRMAKNASIHKIKTEDLQKARKTTGLEPKLKAEDWIDGVVRTLKNHHFISPENEEKVIEKTIPEISKLPPSQAPRYRAITAVYKAMKSSGIKINMEDIHNIFNVSASLLQEKKPTSHYDKIAKDVTEFLRKTPETLYQSKDLVEILGLDIKPGVLAQALSSRIDNLGILNLKDPSWKNYFGFSNICGSGHCYSDWCEEPTSFESRCRTRKKNTELKLYSKS